MKAIKTYLKKKNYSNSFQENEIEIVKNLIESKGLNSDPILQIFVEDSKKLFDFDDFKNVIKFLNFELFNSLAP